MPKRKSIKKLKIGLLTFSAAPILTMQKFFWLLYSYSLDDIANYFPARITALLIAFYGMSSRAFQFIIRFGSAHMSPNAGYPEAALSGILNVQFGGDHDYFGEVVSKPIIGNNKREINISDLKKTIQINRRVEILMFVLMIVAWIITDLPCGARSTAFQISDFTSFIFTLKPQFYELT